jgi:hypothetical protein
VRERKEEGGRESGKWKFSELYPTFRSIQTPGDEKKEPVPSKRWGKHNPQALLSKIPKKKEDVATGTTTGTGGVTNHKKRIGLIFDR